MSSMAFSLWGVAMGDAWFYDGVFGGLDGSADVQRVRALCNMIPHCLWRVLWVAGANFCHFEEVAVYCPDYILILSLLFF